MSELERDQGVEKRIVMPLPKERRNLFYSVKKNKNNKPYDPRPK
jgi:hypothetical protein